MAPLRVVAAAWPSPPAHSSSSRTSREVKAKGQALVARRKVPVSPPGVGRLNPPALQVLTMLRSGPRSTDRDRSLTLSQVPPASGHQPPLAARTGPA